MADIAPLTPLRYDLRRLERGLADVVAPPYDVIDEAGRRELFARHPNNVCHLILPEGEGDAKYAHAGELLSQWVASGVLTRDEEPGFYVYEQTFTPPGGGAPITRTGFLGLVRLVPFSERVVLPHERTLSGPKEDRLKLFRATKTNLSPGFMLYRDPQAVVQRALADRAVVAELTTDDGVRHVLSKVSRPEAIRAVVDHVKTSQLLIADGHHRYETALRYAEETTAVTPGAHPSGAHRWFMVFFASSDDPNLVVFPTHRHVHSLDGFSWRAAVDGLAAWFDVRDLGAGATADAALAAIREAGAATNAFAMCGRSGEVVVVTRKPGKDLGSHPVLGALPEALRLTDVAVLHGAILESVLGITKEAQAAKTNLFYPQDAARALGELRGGKGQALFLMNATPVDHVRAVAEAGEVMPQKSTFFYPKVATGLCIHTLEPSRPVVV
jgi:uncharacterized protein (DUF1015 family)